MSGFQQEKKYDLYNINNLPENNDIAINRLNELLTRVEYIKTQIEFNTEGMFDSVESYKLWREKALCAIAATRREIGFIGCWLEGRPGIDPVINKHIQTKCETRVSSIIPKLNDLISEELPSDKTKAKEKYLELGLVIAETCCSISGIRGTLSDGIFSPEKIKKIVYPLVSAMTQINKKRRQLKKIFTPR
jgi:hypothetical protein